MKKQMFLAVGIVMVTGFSASAEIITYSSGFTVTNSDECSIYMDPVPGEFDEGSVADSSAALFPMDVTYNSDGNHLDFCGVDSSYFYAQYFLSWSGWYAEVADSLLSSGDSVSSATTFIRSSSESILVILLMRFRNRHPLGC